MGTTIVPTSLCCYEGQVIYYTVTLNSVSSACFLLLFILALLFLYLLFHSPFLLPQFLLINYRCDAPPPPPSSIRSLLSSNTPLVSSLAVQVPSLALMPVALRPAPVAQIPHLCSCLLFCFNVALSSQISHILEDTHLPL